MGFMSQEQLAALTGNETNYLYDTNSALGYHPETIDRLFVPIGDRYSGMYIVGVQGVGKSGLLQNLIRQDADACHAIVVIDPHGDLTDGCIAQLPEDRLDDTYLLELTDEAYPFGANLFGHGPFPTEEARSGAVERILHIFEVLWPDVLSQQNLPRYVRAATLALLDNPGSTLVDMYAFLLDADVRGRMLSRVTDSTVRQFWAVQYNNLTPAEQSRRVQSLVNRLESLFLGRALVRNIVGQPRTSVDFRRAIEERQIIFIKLPVKTLTQDARLIGTILLAKLSAAIFSFGNVPEEKRPGVSVYVDEFQHYTTPTFKELFTEGRKFGVRLTLAHQYRGQLPEFLQESTMTARTKIVFQTTPEDGRELAHLFPVPTELRAEDIEPHVTAHLLTYGCDDPYVHVFIEHYLRPMLLHKHGRRVEIRDPGYGVMDFMFDLHSGGQSREPLFVPDPTPYLDSLLYEVMRRRDPNLPIPPDATFGFGNCGRGFYKATRHASREILGPDVTYPLHLLLATPNGRYTWTRPPENANEQLYHFIFHLRMTMKYLAANPLGEPTAVSATEVGRMLTQLPRRTAFVNSGEVVSVIRTHDTADEVTGEELAQRMAAIRRRTRTAYGHPRQEVERRLQAAATPEEDLLLAAPEDQVAESLVTSEADGGEPVTSRWEGI